LAGKEAFMHRSFFSILASALGLACLPAMAWSGMFAQLGGAKPLAMNTHAVGGFVYSSDDQFGLQGDLRMSIYPGVDFGFLGGVSRLSTPAGDRGIFRFGTDVQAEIGTGGSFPLDIGVGGSLGIEIGDDFLVLGIGPELRLSREFPMGSSGTITPYGGVLLAFNRVDVAGTDEVEITTPFRLGADLTTGTGLGFLMEFQLTELHSFADDFLFSAGARMPF
jgi:hypothetical protein